MCIRCGMVCSAAGRRACEFYGECAPCLGGNPCRKNALGIIIGIASVIGILTVGDGLTGNINNQMSTLGATNIYFMLQSKSTEDEGGMRAYEDGDLISDEMIGELRARYQNSIDYISLSESVANGTAKDGKLYANVSVTGVNEEYAGRC